MRSESSSVETGREPGMRLASAQNAFLAFPGGKRKGALTNPGRKSGSGRKARLATSNPAMTEPRKKLIASAARPPSRSRDPSAGRSARLVQAAAAAAANPTGRSAAFQPEIASHKAKKSAARTAAALTRRGGASFSRALKNEIRQRSRDSFGHVRNRRVRGSATLNRSATMSAKHRRSPSASKRLSKLRQRRAAIISPLARQC